MQSRILTICVASILLTGCETLSRPFTSEAKFGSVGGSISPTRLPDPSPDNAHLGGLRVRIDSTLANEDEEFVPSFLAALRDASGGRYKSMRGIDKDPQFELVITEMNEQNGFDGNKIGAVVGAIGGAAGGAAIDKKNRYRGGAIGGAAGAATGYVLTGEKKDVFAFQVQFRQRTSVAGAATFGDKSRDNTGSGGGVSDRDTQVNTGARSVQSSTESTQFDFKSKVAQQTRYFTISAQSGVFHTEGARKARVREMMLKRVPSWLMGGKDVGF